MCALKVIFHSVWIFDKDHLELEIFFSFSGILGKVFLFFLSASETNQLTSCAYKSWGLCGPSRGQNLWAEIHPLLPEASSAWLRSGHGGPLLSGESTNGMRFNSVIEVFIFNYY